MRFPINPSAKNRSEKIADLCALTLALVFTGIEIYFLYQFVRVCLLVRSHALYVSSHELLLLSIISILFFVMWALWMVAILMARRRRKEFYSKLSGSVEVGWGYVKFGTIYISTKDIRSIRKMPRSIDLRYSKNGEERFLHFPLRWLRKEDVDQVVLALKEAIA